MRVERTSAAQQTSSRRRRATVQSNTLLVQGIHDILQIFNATGQTIDSRDNQRVALPQKIQQKLQLSSAIPAGTARFF